MSPSIICDLNPIPTVLTWNTVQVHLYHAEPTTIVTLNHTKHYLHLFVLYSRNIILILKLKIYLPASNLTFQAIGECCFSTICFNTIILISPTLHVWYLYQFAYTVQTNATDKWITCCNCFIGLVRCIWHSRSSYSIKQNN